MKSNKLTLGFPLLVKELTELAARKRTYYLRVLYAVSLFAAALFVFWVMTYDRRYNGPFAVLGTGGDMFHALVNLQFAGIYLFLPAMTCTAITAEKERDALALLLLTRLGPWTILWEKLLSRLIPMFTLILLALPLMAFAYTYGGLQQQEIWGAVLMLAVTSIQVAALCLMCSSFFRTTVAAYIAAYLIGAAIFPAIPLLVEQMVVRLNEDIALMFVGPYVFDEVFVRGSGFGGELAVRLIPFALSIAVFMGLARYWLLRRAFAQPRYWIRNFFRRLDGIFTKLNQNRITRGVVLTRERSTLPLYEPVAWRETEKKNLGRFRYLIRVFLGLELPLAFICTSAVLMERRSPVLAELSVTLCFLWGLAALIISVQAASLISGERSRQTLDVLLVSPLSGREIVLQKVQGLTRLLWVLAACFLTVFLFEVWWYYNTGISHPRGYDGLRYFIGSVLSLAVYFPLIVWLSMWIGLKTTSPTRAILLSVAVFALWSFLPFFLFVTTTEITRLPPSNTLPICFLGPSGMIAINEFNEFPRYGPPYNMPSPTDWLYLLGNYAFYAVIVWGLRKRCLDRADTYLGRREDVSRPSEVATPAPPPAMAVAGHDSGYMT